MRESGRARYFAATALAAAVRCFVNSIESITASGVPFAASNNTSTPWIVGSGALFGKFAFSFAAK